MARLGIQILPVDTRYERIGSGIGSALAGLGQIGATRKEKRQMSEALKSLGLPEEQAKQIPNLSPDLQKLALQNFSQQQKQQQAQQQQQNYSQAIAALYGAPLATVQEIAQEDIETPSALIPQVGPQEAQDISITQLPDPSKIALLMQNLPPNEAMKIAQLYQKQLDAQQKSMQYEEKQRAEAFKETKQIRKEILQESKDSQEGLRALKRMNELNEEGKLQQPAFFDPLLKKIGFNRSAVMNPESQEFEKLTVGFLKNLKSIFGGRISNMEVEQFMKGLPNLFQTKAGRRRVINNMKAYYQGSALKFKMMQKIIKENNGKPPLDLAEKVEERLQPKLDKLAEKFKKKKLEIKKIEEREAPKDLGKLSTGSRYLDDLYYLLGID